MTGVDIPFLLLLGLGLSLLAAFLATPHLP